MVRGLFFRWVLSHQPSNLMLQTFKFELIGIYIILKLSWPQALSGYNTQRGRKWISSGYYPPLMVWVETAVRQPARGSNHYCWRSFCFVISKKISEDKAGNMTVFWIPKSNDFGDKNFFNKVLLEVSNTSKKKSDIICLGPGSDIQ